MLRHGHLTFLPNLIIANAPAIFNEKAYIYIYCELYERADFTLCIALMTLTPETAGTAKVDTA